jgi:8-oxo-dGTP pyrophosphatase MutT (NUDIX family)
MASATPRPAASLILLRRGGRHREQGVELLLVRRSPEASFMPGVWVFPGGTVDPGDPGDEEAAHRACAVRELHEEAGIELEADAELLAWSRWITPEFVSVRFDTRFYVALAPAHSPPRPDRSEITEAAWIAPGEALERHSAGELALVFPTIKHLEALIPYSSADQVLAAARDRAVEPVLPRVVGEGSERRVVLPGDPEY